VMYCSMVSARSAGRQQPATQPIDSIEKVDRNGPMIRLDQTREGTNWNTTKRLDCRDELTIHNNVLHVIYSSRFHHSEKAKHHNKHEHVQCLACPDEDSFRTRSLIQCTHIIGRETTYSFTMESDQFSMICTDENPIGSALKCFLDSIRRSDI
jgi:hypothetical protein